MKVTTKGPAAAAHPNQDMVALRRDIEALIERARTEGYAEVGYFLGVALEALTSALEIEPVSQDGDADIDGEIEDPDLPVAG